MIITPGEFFLFGNWPLDTGMFFANLSIGNEAPYIAEFATDSATVPTARVYVQLSLFAPAGVLPPAGVVPSSGYYYLDITPSTPLATNIPMVWSGGPEQQTHRAQLRLENLGGVIVMYVRGRILLLEDIGQWGATSVNNGRRLRFASLTETVPLSPLPAVSAYTSPNRMAGVAVWVQNQATAEVAFGVSTNAYPLRFYERENNPLTPAAVRVTQWQLRTQTGATTNALLGYERTKMKLRIQGPASTDTLKVFVYMWRLGSVTFPVPVEWGMGGGLDVGDVQTVGAGTDLPMPATIQTLANVPYYLTGPAVAPYWDAAEGAWFCEFEIKNAALNSAAQYQLAAVMNVGTGTNFASWSSISPELSVTMIPPLVPPAIVGSLHDYYQAFGPNLLATPQERLAARLEIDPAPYDTARVKGLLASLRSVGCVLYYEEAGYRQEVASYIWQVNPQTGQVTANGSELEASYAAGKLNLGFKFRTRYEGSQPNLRTVDMATGNALQVATGNQDWQGRAIWLEWRLRAVHTQPVSFDDVLVYRQRVEVRAFDTGQTITLTAKLSNGRPVAPLCADETEFVVLEAYDELAEPADVLWLIDKEGFNINNLRERSKNPGLQGLPQLEQSPLAGPSGQFYARKARVRIDPRLLVEDVTYRVSAIRKPTQVTPPVTNAYVNSGYVTDGYV